MKIKEIELKNIWKKYIKRRIYRVVPSDQKKDILKKGFDPNKDPYEKYNPKIKKIFDIIKKLERKGIVLVSEWANGPVTGSTIVKVSMRSVKGKYIDFVAKRSQVRTFKRKWDGGCLVTYVFKLSKFLLENVKELNAAEIRLAKYLNRWALNKMGKRSLTLYILGSNKIFESAKFYYFSPEFRRYWVSPFGSFEHFKKVVRKYGLNKYLSFLKDEKLFYLRVTKKIPSGEIKFLKN
jgi:hypothetical protein